MNRGGFGTLFFISFLPESSLAHAVDSIMGKFSTYAKYKYELLDEHRAIDALYREILLRHRSLA